MGLIRVTVSLRATQRSRKQYEADFLVDPGATDSMAPAAELCGPAFAVGVHGVRIG